MTTELDPEELELEELQAETTESEASKAKDANEEKDAERSGIGATSCFGADLGASGLEARDGPRQSTACSQHHDEPCRAGQTGARRAVATERRRVYESGR